MSEVNQVLRNLTKQNALLNWDANANQAFYNLKNFLIKPPVLKYYNVNKEITLSVDASQNGLGAVLL